MSDPGTEISASDLTRVAFSGVMAALQERNVPLHEFPGPILAGIVAWPGMNQGDTAGLGANSPVSPRLLNESSTNLAGAMSAPEYGRYDELSREIMDVRNSVDALAATISTLASGPPIRQPRNQQDESQTTSVATDQSADEVSLAQVRQVVGNQVGEFLLRDSTCNNLLQMLAALTPDTQKDRTGEFPLLLIPVFASAEQSASGQIRPAADKSDPADGGIVIDGGDAGSGGSAGGGSGGPSWDVGISCTGNAHWVHNVDGGWSFEGDSPGAHASAHGRP